MLCEARRLGTAGRSGRSGQQWGFPDQVQPIEFDFQRPTGRFTGGDGSSAVWARSASGLPTKRQRARAQGRMAKQADARDLKSRIPHGVCGFDSRSGH